jgi:DNA-binding GntR family transcriptional regulator
MPMRRDPEPSALHRRLAARIVEAVRAGGEAGVSELGLARELGVSRTPVRATLEWLQRQGLARRAASGGWRAGRARARLRESLDLAPPASEADRLYIAIARDRLQEALPAEVSEADLMRSYGASRAVVQQVLARLAEVGVAERKRGHGWRFLELGYDQAAHDESYAFRLLIEPAAMLAPGFAPAPAWLASMRERHRAMMRAPWRETSAVALFDLNAEFHEGLAAASGNRFYAMAIAQQNRLRRFVNLHWTDGAERVQVSCREHLQILEHVAAGEADVASVLMRRHLLQASRL